MCPIETDEVDCVSEPLDSPDPGSVLICCSKPRTNVVVSARGTGSFGKAGWCTHGSVDNTVTYNNGELSIIEMQLSIEDAQEKYPAIEAWSTCQ